MNKRALGVGLMTLMMAGSALALDVGDRLPRELRGRRYTFDDWRDMNLRRPPRGAHWAFIDGDYLLVAANGTVVDVVEGRPEPPRRPRNYGYAPPPPPGPPAFAPPPGPPPGWDRWRARYNRTYDLQDDRA